jgi:hypothetical protein
MVHRAEENQLKFENYKEQFRRLNKALANGFNLEAMFIEYAILEDRTESILRHAGLCDAYLNSRKGHMPTIESKIRYIKKYAENKKSLLHKYFSGDLLDQVMAWKDERNRLIHALLKQRLTDEEVIRIAQVGSELARKIRSRTTSYNRATQNTDAECAATGEIAP